MDIKIVGSVSDENSLDEIENIMNVFAYEQRMKDYTLPIHAPGPKKEVKIFGKKIVSDTKLIPINHPHILVKGLS